MWWISRKLNNNKFMTSPVLVWEFRDCEPNYDSYLREVDEKFGLKETITITELFWYLDDGRKHKSFDNLVLKEYWEYILHVVV